MAEPIQVDNNGRRIHDSKTRKMLESMGLATRSTVWEMDADKIKIVFDATKKKVEGLKVLTPKELETAKLVLGSKMAKIKNVEDKKMMANDIKTIDSALKILNEARSMGGGAQKVGFGRDKNVEIQKVDQGKNYEKDVQKAKEGMTKSADREQSKSNDAFEKSR